jgi:hypothetical protein
VGLLQTLRTDVGLPMRGSYPPHLFEQGNDEPAVMRQRWYGYTTDRAKADAARDAGATVTSCPSSDQRFHGWEVTVTEVVE